MEKIVLSNLSNPFGGCDTKRVEMFCNWLQKEGRYAICSRKIYDQIFNSVTNDNVLVVKDLLIPNDVIYIITRKPYDTMLQF